MSIGDSITFGPRVNDPSIDSYPSKLQSLLGNGYQVLNFGVSSCTLLRNAQPNVWSELEKIRASKSNIIIISLGTNDTCGMNTCGERKCWEFKDDFEQDYLDLIDEMKSFSFKPKIFICAPTPMVLETPGLSKQRTEVLSIRKPRLQELIGIIKKVTRQKNVGFINLNSSLDH